MLTPKQQKLLATLDPDLIARFDLVPVPSTEFKTNQAIADRVTQWLQQATNTKPRQVHHDRLPWEEPYLNTLGPNPF